jgi:hypothetical protein
MYRPSYIEPDAMRMLGYLLVSDKDGYLAYENVAGLEATDYGRMAQGKRKVYFNTTYSPNAVFMGVREDGGTRNVYNGIITSESYMRMILENVR